MSHDCHLRHCKPAGQVYGTAHDFLGPVKHRTYVQTLPVVGRLAWHWLIQSRAHKGCLMRHESTGGWKRALTASVFAVCWG